MVVIVDTNQVTEFQVTSRGGGLTGNTLHSTAITEVDICVVVEEVVAGLVEHTTAVGLGNGQTNSVGETLTEGTSGHLNTGGVVSLGMTGGDAVELLEQLLLANGQAAVGMVKLTRKALMSSMDTAYPKR